MKKQIMVKNKQTLGQFYTTNFKYILEGMYIPENIINIIEPFTGKGDLLSFLSYKKYNLECFDIDPKTDYTIKRDTLLEPPEYKNKFILTNPPYLARNKSKDKTLFDLYNMNDLYKCCISELVKQDLLGGILIIPVNFWSSIRKADVSLRQKFLIKYKIVRVNIFEESVFDDTDYSVCSFQFERKISTIGSEGIEDSLSQTGKIPFFIYPSKLKLELLLNYTNNYTIGGELYCLPQNKKFKIGRLIKGMRPSTNILLKCIDDGSTEGRLGLSIQKKLHYDNTEKRSERSYATITIEPEVDIRTQELLVEKFNKFIEEKRTQYNSLFLTNYRENARKRISFDLAFDIIGHLLYLEEF